MNQITQRPAIGSAHSKLILLGEHSVVYGMPAIALPFPLLEVVSTVEKISDQITLICDYYRGPLGQVPHKLRGIASCISETLHILNQPEKGLLIRLHSSIPIGRGLGSSAAIAIAIVKSLFAFHRQSLEPKVLMSLVHKAETFAHGTPSGIDMAAALSDFPIWFQKGKKIRNLQLGGPLFLIVADTGHFGDTRAAVLSVRDKFRAYPESTQKSVNQLGVITLEARAALSAGNLAWLGSLFDQAQAELVDLGVSDDTINRLVDTAKKAGSLGAKLTGGGRGGCVLALAKNLAHAKRIANTLIKAGASNTWYFRLDGNG
ncbi:mevalonate kinase [Bacillus sp. MM2020_1]|nr:mevalonate kinase [Bacillus sp. MM2020_1]